MAIAIVHCRQCPMYNHVYENDCLFSFNVLRSKLLIKTTNRLLKEDESQTATVLYH